MPSSNASKADPTTSAMPEAAAAKAAGEDPLRQLADASQRYLQTIAEARTTAAKTYYDLLNGLGQTVQTIAQDRTAADLIARYQVELARRWRTQDLSDLHQQYLDVVQKLTKLQQDQGASLGSAVEALQAKATELGENSARAAEKAAKSYVDAVAAVARDDALRGLDPGALAQLGYGVLAAAAIKSQAARE